MGRPVHRLRHLQAFLERQPRPGDPNHTNLFATAIGIPLMAIAIAMAAARLALVGVVMVAFIAAMIFMFTSTRPAKTVGPSIDTWTPEGNRALEEFRGFSRDSSLEDRLDPEVGDELNACCAIFLGAKHLLSQETWIDVEGPRLDAKESAIAALSALMDDAFAVALSGVRAKGQRRDVFAKRMTNEKFKSPMIASLADLRLQLGDLKREIEMATEVDAQDVDSVRDAIERISEIRRAEEELRDSMRT